MSFNPLLAGKAIATSSPCLWFKCILLFQPAPRWKGDRDALRILPLQRDRLFQPAPRWKGDRDSYALQRSHERLFNGVFGKPRFKLNF